MEASSDGQRIDSLEKKIDEGFAELRTQIVDSERALRGEIASLRGEVHGVRADGRSDFRTLLAIWAATLLAVVGLLASHI
jgi:hypothetical protein